MATVKITLEDRVAALEAEVARLREKLDKGTGPPKDGWQRIRGIFADDPDFEEIVRLGREYRESLRPKPAKRRKR
jgi:hypothetical protein